MNPKSKLSVRLVRVLAPALVFGLAAAPAVALDVAMVLSTTSVAPGGQFDIRLEVTSAGEAFNAFDATVDFDPAALTFLQMSPLSLQEGALMQNACSNRFHLFSTNPITITEALLCPGVQVTGPGTVYVLRFRASSVAQWTQVRLSALEFYASGYSVPLSPVSPLTITIGTPSDAPPAAEVSVVPRLSAWPNPFNPATTIDVESPRAGMQRLVVCDVRGRLVRVLQAGSFPAGKRTVSWDGLDQAGATLGSGVYTLVLQADNSRSTHRLVLLK